MAPGGARKDITRNGCKWGTLTDGGDRAKSIDDVCEMIKNAAGDKKLKSVVIGGHCGGPGKDPGVILTKGDPKKGINQVRIDSKMQPADVKKLKEAIDKYLDKDATIIICSCGYMKDGTLGEEKWKNSLKELAKQLGRRVCAPPGSVGHGGARGCICEGYKLIGQDP